jgi:hypothetical protein
MTASRSRRSAFLVGSLALLAVILGAGGAHARDVYARDATQLAKALAAALPGDRIILTASSYSGNFSVTRAGTATAPIIVQAVTTLSATISGTFAVKAADVTLSGLAVKRGIILQGNRARASRCKVEASGSTPAVEIASGTDVAVEFCDLSKFTGRGIQITDAASKRSD